jgi:hypothetical protein
VELDGELVERKQGVVGAGVVAAAAAHACKQRPLAPLNVDFQKVDVRVISLGHERLQVAALPVSGLRPASGGQRRLRKRLVPLDVGVGEPFHRGVKREELALAATAKLAHQVLFETGFLGDPKRVDDAVWLWLSSRRRQKGLPVADPLPAVRGTTDAIVPWASEGWSIMVPVVSLGFSWCSKLLNMAMVSG